MKEKITQINASIDEKCGDLRKKADALREKADKEFSAMTATASATPATGSEARPKSTPPISYILYGAAAASVVGAMCSDDSKTPLFLLAAACAAGGYKLSGKGQTPSTVNSTNAPDGNLDTVKSRIDSKVLDTVKAISQEWEMFMEQKQGEVQQIVRESVAEAELDEKLSKVCLYEIIDIRTSSFLASSSHAGTPSELKQAVDQFHQELRSAIDKAAESQKAKYSSLI